MYLEVLGVGVVVVEVTVVAVLVVLGSRAVLGVEALLGAGAVVGAEAELGAEAVLGARAVVGAEAVLGAGASVGATASFLVIIFWSRVSPGLLGDSPLVAAPLLRTGCVRRGSAISTSLVGLINLLLGTRLVTRPELVPVEEGRARGVLGEGGDVRLGVAGSK